MAVLPETIHFAANENLRLLRWESNRGELLQDLEACGRRSPVAGVGGRWHSHKEMELTIVQRGSGTRYVGDHVGSFGELECILLGSYLPHCWMTEGVSSGLVLQFQLPEDHALYKLGGSEELQWLFSRAEHGIQYRPAIARFAIEILEAIANGSKLRRAGLFLELLALLHEALSDDATLLSHARIRAVPNGGTRPCLETSIQWILEHFTEPILLEEAARRSAMSRATFCRQFLSHTGKSFHVFLTDARLVHAHQLLIQTELSIADIAHTSGFGSLARFNAAFRKKFAAAPRVVRKSIHSTATIRGGRRT